MPPRLDTSNGSGSGTTGSSPPRRHAALHPTRQTVQNAFADSFNAWLRDELLDATLFDASNTVGRATGGAISIRSGMGALAGDAKPADASKMRNVNPLDAFTGPSVRLAADVFETGVALPLRLSAGGSATYGDIKRAKNLLPLHAVPVFQQGLSWLRDDFAERHGLEKPAPRQ